MINKGKRIISIALSTVIIVGGSGTYAAGFKDVASNYWAKSYIDRGSKLGLFKGYDDGTFKPLSNIYRVEVISLVSRVLGLSESEVNSLEAKYLDRLIKNNVPDWAFGDFAVALSKGILDEKTLTPQFLYNKSNTYDVTTREEMCIYLVRAMGLESEAKGIKTIKLGFKDTDKINKDIRAYVQVLVSKGVISGNDKNEFKPTDPISRAEVAKVLTSVYDYIQNNKKEEVVVPPVVDKTFDVSGTIFAVRSLNNGKVYIDITNDKTNSIETYEADSKTDIKFEYGNASLSKLDKGMKIKLEVIDDKNRDTKLIKSINSENSVVEHKGIIESLKSTNLNTITIRDEYNYGSTRVFTLADDTKIMLDDKQASFKDLRTQDTVTIKIVNNKLDSIYAKSKYRDVEGIVKWIDYSMQTINIEDKDGNKREFNIGRDANIKKDSKRVSFEDIKLGDKVKLSIEENVVRDVNAETVVSYVEGIIKGLNIASDKSVITITNGKTGKDEQYTISKKVALTLDSNRANIYEYKIGFHVDLRLEGIEVTNIDGRTRNIINNRIGTIERVGRDYLEVRVPVDNYKDEIITVEVTRDTSIISDDGRTLAFSSLEKFDEVIIKGDYYGKDIVAKSIIVTKYRK